VLEKKKEAIEAANKTAVDHGEEEEEEEEEEDHDGVDEH